MESTTLKRLSEMNISEMAWDILNTCRGEFSNSSLVYAVAYVLLKAQTNPGTSVESVEAFEKTSGESMSRMLFIRNTIKNSWRFIPALKDKYNRDELTAIILYYEPVNRLNDFPTPHGVSMLAVKLLNVKPGDRVADFGTGRGGFIRDCFLEEANAEYYGNDINTSAVEVASIRAEILGGNISIVQEDLFDMKDESRRFDVAFANYPFGMRAKEAKRSGFNKYEEFIRKNPDFSKTVSLDWLFNKKVYSTIAGPRRAVCLMTNGSTWNTLDKTARMHFLAGGSVEAVIALPNNLFEYTSIGTVMIVFSHGNTSVMMVDARELCERGRRVNTFSEENIDEIIAAVHNEGKYSKRIRYDELKANEFVLNPIRYLGEEIKVENGVPFESIIKRITRGAPVTASMLDDMVSETPTDYQYLMLANIRDGIIDDELPYLKEIESKLEKYCIKNNSLILSKNGYPFKVAVADVPEGKSILANGNLFVIEIDEERADPYFIKAFFESDTGVASLKSIVVGATIPNIGIEQLKKIIIPCPPLEVQKETANRYLMLVDEVKLLRRKMDKATSNLRHLFDLSKEG